MDSDSFEQLPSDLFTSPSGLVRIDDDFYVRPEEVLALLSKEGKTRIYLKGMSSSFTTEIPIDEVEAKLSKRPYQGK